LKDSWAEPDIRDEVVDYVRYWSSRTEIKAGKIVNHIGITRSKYYDWRSRYGKTNEHNAWIPRDFYLTDREKRAIIAYYNGHPLEGYRRLTYMMMDDDIVAVSPSSVYRVLVNAGLLRRWNRKPSKKGAGFQQPLKAHEHWNIISGMTHVKTSPYYPQSNGKLERYHRTIKGTCIRVKTPLSLEDARRLVTDFVDHYNNKRLHSGIGYVTPKDKLQGRAEMILAERDAKLIAA